MDINNVYRLMPLKLGPSQEVPMKECGEYKDSGNE